TSGGSTTRSRRRLRVDVACRSDGSSPRTASWSRRPHRKASSVRRGRRQQRSAHSPDRSDVWIVQILDHFRAGAHAGRMSDEPWHLDVVTPALLRHARTTYGSAMRIALEDAGYDDIPPNGLYVIGALAMDETMPLSQVIQDLRVSKQSAGQLVDALVTRGYLDRDTDPGDRR